MPRLVCCGVRPSFFVIPASEPGSRKVVRAGSRVKPGMTDTSNNIEKNMETKQPKEIPFMKYRYLVLGLSALLVAASFFLLFTKGLNYGTDFKGGLKLIYEIKVPTNEAQLTSLFPKGEFPDLVVQRFGEAGGNTFVIKSDVPEQVKEEEYAVPFTKKINEALGEGSASLIKEEFVGPKVGKELRTKGIYAVIWAWVIMLIYIGFRFDFFFAPGAIVALIHDVVITLGAFALTGREVNLTVVAAFLTIVGYSVNDTIIVFDRVRENIQKYKGLPLIDIVNRSISQILVRTIITSLTVFFVVMVLFLRAEGDIQNFAFAMIWGVVVGTYSSTFVAVPIFLFLRKHGHRIGMKPKTAKVA